MLTLPTRQAGPVRRLWGGRNGGWVARHPWVGLFMLAFGLRMLLVTAISLRSGGTLFSDDTTYTQAAEAAADGRSGLWTPYERELYERTATLLVPLTGLYRLFGPHPVLGQALVAAFGAGTAVCAARTAYEALGRRGAAVAGLGVALLPSQVLFSSVVMKDAPVWFFLSLLALLVTAAVRAQGVRLVAIGVAVFTALTLLGYLRLSTQLTAAIALALCALFLRHPRHRFAVGAVGLLIALTAPWAAGSGIGGTRLLTGFDASALQALREEQSFGASALDPCVGLGCAPPPTVPDLEPPVRAPVPSPELTEQPPPIDLPAGDPPPSGDAERAAPPAPVADAADPRWDTLRDLPRGLGAVLLGPVPWTRTDSTALRVAGLENLVWYAVLGLSLTGLPLAWRHRRVTLFPLLVGGGCVFMWALVEGNVGTAFRHRGEVVWAGWLLAGFGAVLLRRARRARSAA